MCNWKATYLLDSIVKNKPDIMEYLNKEYITETYNFTEKFKFHNNNKIIDDKIRPENTFL